MTLRPHVFTIASLDALLAASPDDDTLLKLAPPPSIGDVLTRVETDRAVFLVHASDTATSRRIVFLGRGCLDKLPPEADKVRTSLQRAHRVALLAANPPLRFPPAWNDYHDRNLVTFFAVPREMGALRWVAQIRPMEAPDVFFPRLTSPHEPVRLERFRSPLDDYVTAVADWTTALEQAVKRFARAARIRPTGIVETIDLDATTYGAVTGNRPYSSWRERLTEVQLRFLDKPTSVSTKIRGPAGSGKTLLLELKALRELYKAREEARPIRILFVTHSWAVAMQVDAALRQLDESGDLSGIDVYPLLSIAQDLLPAERKGRGFSVLGDDNLSGKMLQLQVIDAILQRCVSGDWLSYEPRCSPDFAARVSARQGSPERNALVWDLMHEFACVLSAHGILPGVNAPRQYLPLHRTPWMMPLVTDAEKMFVLDIYGALVSDLRGQRLLTSDQLVNDFLNYLSTFAWNLRRADDGYDVACVDELHLFNEQERFALHFLSRNPNAYPIMLMALDPRQSPTEVYAASGLGAIASSDSGDADADLGVIDSVELRTVHRFSPEILRLVRHINESYPALGLGEEWAFDGSDIQTSAAATGKLPTVKVHADRPSEIDAVMESAEGYARDLPAGERVAVVLVDALALGPYEELAKRERNVTTIRGRDDVDSLQYSRRSIVLSAAEYVSGLQFTVVVVAGFPRDLKRTANVGHQQRRLLSLLYLSVSRATTVVEIHVNTADGGVPPLLEGAIDDGIVRAG